MIDTMHYDQVEMNLETGLIGYGNDGNVRVIILSHNQYNTGELTLVSIVVYLMKSGNYCRDYGFTY